MKTLTEFEDVESMVELFREYGIKAHPGSSTSCAISQYIRDETGLYTSSSPRSINVWAEDLDYTDSAITTVTMREFILAYDTGEYPDLVEEGYEVKSINKSFNYHSPF